MAKFTNLYDLIGAQPSWSNRDIEKAYRRRVKSCHPDHNPSPDALETFYALHRAYQILMDPEKRRDYDLTLERYASKPSPASRLHTIKLTVPKNSRKKKKKTSVVHKAILRLRTMWT